MVAQDGIVLSALGFFSPRGYSEEPYWRDFIGAASMVRNSRVRSPQKFF